MSFTRPAGEIQATEDEKGYWQVTVTQHAERSYALENIPARWSEFGGDYPFSHTTRRTARFEENENGARGILRLTYSDEPVGGSSNTNPEDEQPDGEPIFEKISGGMTLPIERHPDYKTIWNHHLWGKGETDDNDDFSFTVDSSDLWNDWYTQSSTDIPEAQSGKFKWREIDDQPESPDGDGNQWGIFREATKPRVEEWVIYGPQIRETTWFSKYQDAVDFSYGRERGIRRVPYRTFGFSSDDRLWLVMENPITPDGERWRVETLYQFSIDGWDTDVYKWKA